MSFTVWFDLLLIVYCLLWVGWVSICLCLIFVMLELDGYLGYVGLLIECGLCYWVQYACRLMGWRRLFWALGLLLTIGVIVV